ncbi:hypothetical protein IQ264_24130 [Phormidium sp. LEGE 05292]|uniref:hypothetical protein n=1 Tax=[Phormidium] sp. LEGE 05292 TaxID=767427 RepID=UPI00187F45A1|nr:hypothetical protein [Phormidium sp. LEGE 05292]MBE9228508.1 hypothetical protein [Phormidium sp. LEGE 05292]
MNYPIVFYPKVIAHFCCQYSLVIKEENQVTLPPNGKEKSQVSKPIVVLSVEWFGLIWLLWLAGVIGLPLLAVSWGWSGIELLLLVAAYSCLMAASYTYLFGYRNQLLSQYQLQSNEHRKPEVYSNSLPQKTLINSEMRCKLLANLMKNRVNPIGRSSARQGVSEKEFMQDLQRYFPTVMQGLEFKIPRSKKCYSADFIILHHSSGIGIDVEVDEPYAGISKKPTHCWDDDSDYRRNQLFNEWSWIVVRFTEKQVVQAPLSCCKFIAQVIWEVTGERSYLELLESQPDLLPVKPWTIKEARQMAKQKYRQSYLLEQKNHK